MNIKNDAELSRVINITPSGISTWKTRNSIDHNKIIELCQEHGLDLNYIFGKIVDNSQTIVAEKSSHYEKRPKDSNDILVESLLKNIALLEDRLKKSEETLKRAREMEEKLMESQKELIKVQAEHLDTQKKLRAALNTIAELKKKKAA